MPKNVWLYNVSLSMWTMMTGWFNASLLLVSEQGLICDTAALWDYQPLKNVWHCQELMAITELKSPPLRATTERSFGFLMRRPKIVQCVTAIKLDWWVSVVCFQGGDNRNSELLSSWSKKHLLTTKRHVPSGSSAFLRGCRWHHRKAAFYFIFSAFHVIHKP